MCAATWIEGGPVFQRGPGTFPVPQRLHDANRKQALRRLREVASTNEGLVLLKGGKGDLVRHSTDHEELFRQESFFHYLFGVEESDCLGTIDVSSGKAALFVPKLPESHAVWMGDIPDLETFRSKYGVDDVHYIDDLEAEVARQNPPRIFLLEGANTDSGLPITAPKDEACLKSFPIESASLHRALVESRALKTDPEIEVMRYVSRVSSEAHVKVLKECKVGMMEYQLESVFLHHCYYSGGCRFSSYTSIVGSGPHGAFLHYGHSGAPNAGVIGDSQLVLCDMGAEYHGYAADITCTFPSGGKFTDVQAAVYNAVLSSHVAVMAAMKPGVSWLAMHELAERHILTGLKDADFLKGSVDDMMRDNLGATFMPHGLGHLIGIDTHDVGGYGYGFPERPARSGADRLRTARLLEERMMITLEPGCYFNRYLLLKAFEDPKLSQYTNEAKLRAHMDLGGVRIEDNILITTDGCESFTSVPRTVEEVEKVMAGGSWP